MAPSGALPGRRGLFTSGRSRRPRRMEQRQVSAPGHGHRQGHGQGDAPGDRTGPGRSGHSRGSAQLTVAGMGQLPGSAEAPGPGRGHRPRGTPEFVPHTEARTRPELPQTRALSPGRLSLSRRPLLPLPQMPASAVPAPFRLEGPAGTWKIWKNVCSYPPPPAPPHAALATVPTAFSKPLIT